MTEKSKQFAELYESLAHKLSTSRKLALTSVDDEPANWATAHGLLDIEESLRDFSAKLTTLCTEELSGTAVDDILFSIGEDFRHILYHIGDMKFYSYLAQEPRDD